MPTPRKKTTKSKDIEDSETSSASPAPRPDEMSPDVVEFMTAMDDYKRRNGRPFPNWSEVLQVVKSLGYARKSA